MGERTSETRMATRAMPLEDHSDDTLMARLAQRDGACLKLLSQRHGELVYRIAYRMLGDAHEAEDIAQEALLRLWTHADRWQGGGSGIAAWLTRVGTNLCLDRLRKQRRMSDGDFPEREDDAPLADTEAQNSETRQAVVECIGDLPERQRASVVLTYYEEMPNRAASEAMDMKIKAFESILVRARKALRLCVESKGVAGDDAERMAR